MPQSALRTQWRRGRMDNGRETSAALVGSQPVFAFRAQIFHHALNELLGLSQFVCDDLNVHGRLGGIAMAVAIDSVLAYQHHRVRHAVKRHREASAMGPQHLFVVLDLFLVVVKCGHWTSPACCNRDTGTALSPPKLYSSYIQTTR